ncbi:hypothetical protein CHS0354_035313 [Potamilus streckersoni]|uniref:Uncharacterized protein n=1 Tax=Potamilus streckersoni TaxID=2493646 RepID=A0AAE0S2S5_9BIVA|nr:hypothetical protein CHS0354_035313 [Potamilus streckersoni]
MNNDNEIFSYEESIFDAEGNFLKGQFEDFREKSLIKMEIKSNRKYEVFFTEKGNPLKKYEGKIGNSVVFPSELYKFVEKKASGLKPGEEVKVTILTVILFNCTRHAGKIMKSVSAQMNREAQYLKALRITLKNIETCGICTEKDRSYMQKVIQGFLLNHFHLKISEHIAKNEGITMDERFMMALSNILYQTVFPEVRAMFDAKPELVESICREVTEEAYEECLSSGFSCEEQLYYRVFKKLYPQKTARDFVLSILNNPEILKLIALYKFERQVPDCAVRNRFSAILNKEDAHIILPLVDRYLNKGRSARLVSLIKSGDWRLEADFLEAGLF